MVEISDTDAITAVDALLYTDKFSYLPDERRAAINIASTLGDKLPQHLREKINALRAPA